MVILASIYTNLQHILYYFMLFRLRSSRPSFKENQEVVQLRTFSDLLVFATRIAGPWMTPVDD
jgi:hypothetical protein